MKAILFQVSKNAMQSGKGYGQWRMIFQRTENEKKSLWKDELMGWTSTNETLQQIVLSFDSIEEAVAYARHKDVQLDIRIERSLLPHAKSYADNFRHNKPKLFG